MRNPSEAESIKPLIETVEPELRTVLYKAFDDQTKIGWSLIRKGFLAKGWGEVISHKVIMINYSFDKEGWEMSIIRALLNRSVELWRLCCKIATVTDETYLEHLRQNAELDLSFLKKNIHVIGLYRNLVRHPPGYFNRASKRTILNWNIMIKEAKKYTKLHLMRSKNTLLKHKFTRK